MFIDWWEMGSKLARNTHTYLALTSLISFTLEKIAECCVLFMTFSPSGLFGSILGSSMNTSVNVAKLRWYVASDVITSKIACNFERKLYNWYSWNYNSSAVAIENWLDTHMNFLSLITSCNNISCLFSLANTSLLSLTCSNKIQLR